MSIVFAVAEASANLEQNDMNLPESNAAKEGWTAAGRSAANPASFGPLTSSAKRSEPSRNTGSPNSAAEGLPSPRNSKKHLIPPKVHSRDAQNAPKVHSKYTKIREKSPKVAKGTTSLIFSLSLWPLTPGPSGGGGIRWPNEAGRLQVMHPPGKSGPLLACASPADG